MGSQNPRTLARTKRKKRIRKKVYGTTERPRLSVFRSARHIYAQVIDDTCGCTMAAASSSEKAIRENPVESTEDKKGKMVTAAAVGKIVAERAIQKGVKQVVFDRNGFLYHGRIKALSDGAREAGLGF